ncbi:MAG TPA: zf-HC2 domain-containing protein, partial [Streptosporangiaceae bacterium]|nr:zf-HC2 domain-containing protein [Streptosporangiaceae bacterium]
MSLGVFVLGAADAAERQRVAGHLPGCPDCRAELARLAPLPGLLAQVPEDLLAAGPGSQQVLRHLGEQPGQRRQPRQFR